MASINSGEQTFEVTIIQAVDLPPFHFNILRSIRMFVQIDTVAQSWRTASVKLTKREGARWEEKFTIVTLRGSTKIVFSLFRKSRFWGKHSTLVGKLEVEMRELFDSPNDQHGGDIILPLARKRVNARHCQLTLQIAESSTTAINGAISQIRRNETKLSAPRLPMAIDTISTTATAVANFSQTDLVKCFTSLIEKMTVLVKVGNELPKIHPYINLAWNVLSAGLKLVQTQPEVDEKIVNLVEEMESTYSAILASDKLKEDGLLQDALYQILKQTIECGFFIQEYTCRGLAGGKATTEISSGIEDLIVKFNIEFGRLRQKFVFDTTIRTALVASQTSAKIDTIRRDQILAYLKPTEMSEDKRSACLTNTRLDATQSIMNWFTDELDDWKNIMWLYGLAGTGKSTLSTTIAWMMRDIERLGAFFFFNRDFPERNAATLIRTLAYQLAQFDARIGAEISRIVEDTPNIAGMSLAVQFTKLLSANALGGIEWSRGPILVVIDALDESGSDRDRESLIQVLSEGFLTLPPFIRILIVSRPERDIRDLFDRSYVHPYELSVNSAASQPDITTFIQHRLGEIRKANKYLALPADWPGDDNIDALVNSASGLFIWASTACLYIDSHDPRKRLNELIKQESVDTSINPFANLHRLYEVALQSAGRWVDPLFCEDFRAILGLILCARTPLSCVAIDSLLGPPRPSLQLISRLGSVLHWSETEAIRILHASFHDYLTLYCRADPWAIGIGQHNAQLADLCISLLDRELRENICALSLPHPVRDESLTEAVSYASTFWIEHVCLVSDVSRGLGDQIYSFLCRHLLHWMEALAIVKSHGVAIRSLQNLLKWIKKFLPGNKDLYRIVYDAHRFSQYFASTIEEHPLLIYVTALPFTPYNTLIYQKFNRNDFPQVVCGVEMSWPPQLQILCGHHDWVTSVAFSHDGSKIVSGSLDRTVRVWDSVTGKEALPPLRGYNSQVASVAFSPDGSKIVSGSEDKMVRVWDAVTGIEALPPLRGHDDWITSVAFSPDGYKIVSGSDDTTVRVWDAVTGTEALSPLRGHDGKVTSVAFSPDGSKIVSGSYDQTVRVWDAATGKETLPPLRGHENGVTSVTFSPDGSKIASGSHDKTVWVWDAVTGKQTLPPLWGHSNWVTSVAFSPDASKIASGSCDNTVRVWDAVTGKEALLPLQGHNGHVTSVAFCPDGSKVVSGSDDETLRVWDAVTGKALPPLWGHDDKVTAVAFSSDGSKVVSGSYDKTVRVWDAVTGSAILPPLRGHEDRVTSVAFSSDGSRIVSGSYDETVRVWDAVTGQAAMLPLRGHESYVISVSFSPNGSTIVSESHNETVRMWDKNGNMLEDVDCDIPGSDQAHALVRLDEQGFFIQIESGRHLSKLPAGFSCYGGQFCRSYFVGWTSHHKLGIIRFPVQSVG